MRTHKERARTFAPAPPPSFSPGAKTASVERRIHNAEEQEKSGGLILDPSDGGRGTDGRRERKERRRRNFAARGGGGDITTHRPSLSYSPSK